MMRKGDSWFFNFLRYNAEIPWYVARDGHNDVTVLVPEGTEEQELVSDSFVFSTLAENNDHGNWDAVIHWRRWNSKSYSKNAVNLLHTCDHTYNPNWTQHVTMAIAQKHLDGVLCYRTWHKRHLVHTLPTLHESRFFTDVTLGVDTEIYKPKEKVPYTMLWASDPGRGLRGCLELFLKLFQQDKRWRLRVCWPYYVSIADFKFNHPGIEWVGNLNNGPALWDMFNTTMFVPYTSTFTEPSSRAHRQGQAAGCIVLYPPSMGSPSELIVSDVDGIVAPIDEWPSIMTRLANDDKRRGDIMNMARKRAVDENWSVQARNLNGVIDDLIGERNG